MVGYPEALTDPSYRGQILVLTFPLIGNYGVPDEGIKDAYGLPEYFESNQIHIAGLVVSSYSWEHSHWAAHKSLAKWLKDNNIPGIYGVDTRALTMKIRSIGALLGNLVVVSLCVNAVVLLNIDCCFAHTWFVDNVFCAPICYQCISIFDNFQYTSYVEPIRLYWIWIWHVLRSQQTSPRQRSLHKRS